MSTIATDFDITFAEGTENAIIIGPKAAEPAINPPRAARELNPTFNHEGMTVAEHDISTYHGRNRRLM